MGTHEEEALPDYRLSGASPCIYVQSSPVAFERLVAQFIDDPWHIAVNAHCYENATGLRPDHTRTAAETIADDSGATATYAVDDLVQAYSSRRPPNLLIIHALGTELRVLRGAKRTLTTAHGVFVAVSETPIFAGASTLEEVQAHLRRQGLHLRWAALDGNARGHAFFSRPVSSTKAMPTYAGNLAIGKTAFQSSLSKWSRPDLCEEAGGAINGKITGDCGFHTDTEENAYWMIDLGRSYKLNEVRIYNRLGSYKWRARTLKILLSENGSEWREVHDQSGYSFGGADGHPLRVRIAQYEARYVALCLTERTCLHLDEVEIY